MSGTLILFTRFPQPGETKTRLAPLLGLRGAAELHRRLAEHALNEARSASLATGVALEIHHTGQAADMAAWLGSDLCFRPQAAGDLGQRMAAAMALATGPVVLMGTDCPDLTGKVLIAAFGLLKNRDAVLGPAADGGYYLIGLRHPDSRVFDGMPWGSGSVLERTRRCLRRIGLTWQETPTLADIDRPEDLDLLPAHLRPGCAVGPGNSPPDRKDHAKPERAET